MAQTGDGQNGNGTGGSKYPNLPAEFSSVPFKRGIVGMARTSDPELGEQPVLHHVRRRRLPQRQVHRGRRGRVRHGRGRQAQAETASRRADPDKMVRDAGRGGREVQRAMLANRTSRRLDYARATRSSAVDAALAASPAALLQRVRRGCLRPDCCPAAGFALDDAERQRRRARRAPTRHRSTPSATVRRRCAAAGSRRRRARPVRHGDDGARSASSATARSSASRASPITTPDVSTRSARLYHARDRRSAQALLAAAVVRKPRRRDCGRPIDIPYSSTHGNNERHELHG